MGNKYTLSRVVNRTTVDIKANNVDRHKNKLGIALIKIKVSKNKSNIK